MKYFIGLLLLCGSTYGAGFSLSTGGPAGKTPFYYATKSVSESVLASTTFNGDSVLGYHYKVSGWYQLNESKNVDLGNKGCLIVLDRNSVSVIDRSWDKGLAKEVTKDTFFAYPQKPFNINFYHNTRKNRIESVNISVDGKVVWNTGNQSISAQELREGLVNRGFRTYTALCFDRMQTPSFGAQSFAIVPVNHF